MPLSSGKGRKKDNSVSGLQPVPFEHKLIVKRNSDQPGIKAKLVKIAHLAQKITGRLRLRGHALRTQTPLLGEMAEPGDPDLAGSGPQTGHVLWGIQVGQRPSVRFGQSEKRHAFREQDATRAKMSARGVPAKNRESGWPVNRAERFGQSIERTGIGDKGRGRVLRIPRREASEEAGVDQRQIAGQDEPRRAGFLAEGGEDPAERALRSRSITQHRHTLAAGRRWLPLAEGKINRPAKLPQEPEGPAGLRSSIIAKDQRSFVAPHARAFAPSKEKTVQHITHLPAV